jgi:hypothetical protein
MNGRTCQLCGKALSRFSVGSGGEFCSREHRNQFRLRLGMDRLQEANKVASLMRRRENAKAIPTAQLARDSKVLPRVAQLLLLPVRQPDVHPLRLVPAALETPRITSLSGNLRSSSPQPAAPVRATARAMRQDSLPLRPKRPLPPPRSNRFSTQIKPAGIVIPSLAAARATGKRRESAELRLSVRRTHIGSTGIQVRPLRAPVQNCQEPQRPRRLNNSADRGQELRVSGGIGFRLPAARIRPIEFTRPRTALPEKSTVPRGLNAVSQPKNGDIVTAGVIRFVLRVPSGPNAPKQNNGTGFQLPEPFLNGKERPRTEAHDNRSCDVRWIAAAPCAPQLRHRNGVARLRPAAPPGPCLSAPPAHGMVSGRRLTLVSFQPQEAPFECPPSVLHGTLLSGMHFGTAPPLRKVEPAPATLEEHFDAGLQNWTGRTDDWKVDVAGVRAGSLAIFSPSLEIPNYQLEFLTRVENRGITWVFRAANFNDYYKATLAVAPGGGYELRRCAVIGGSPEQVVVKPVPPATPVPSGKTAVTVRTRVVGDEFAVSLDGQAVDTWADARLTAGGIGFVGAPEERARLYWVKVTPLGQSSKEYSKR